MRHDVGDGPGDNPDLWDDGPPAASDSRVCEFCGSSPTAKVSLRRQVGMLVQRNVESLDGHMCRDCGTATYRSMTNRTLITGWWSPIGMFANLLHVLRNVRSGRRLARLDEPRRTEASDAAPLDGPMDPGKRLRSRSGPWVAAALWSVVMFGAISATLGTATRDDTGTITRGGSLDVAELQVGDCFEGPEDDTELTDVRVVPCEERHHNEIYHVAELPYGSDAPFPGEDLVFQIAGEACASGFEGFIGVPYQRSELDFAMVAPSRDSWENDDRTFVCAVYDPVGPVAGTLAGTKR